MLDSTNDDTAREFLAELTNEEEFFVRHLRKDQLGVALITAIKEFDHFCYQWSGEKNQRIRKSFSKLCGSAYPE